MENSIRSRTWLGPAVIFLLFIFQQGASKIGALAANSFDYSIIDEYGVFAWISVHHIIQMLLGVLVIIILSKIYGMDFGLRFRNKDLGIKYVKIFTSIIFISTVISYAMRYFSNQILQYEYPLNLKNVLGYLGFQLLLSGPSEEILFRALPISIITYWVTSSREIKIAKWKISFANIISAIFFSVAHISWTVRPFTISMNYFQLIYSLILGIVYGNVYEKTESVIYPMIMHSISNVMVVGCGFLLEYIIT